MIKGEYIPKHMKKEITENSFSDYQAASGIKTDINHSKKSMENISDAVVENELEWVEYSQL